MSEKVLICAEAEAVTGTASPARPEIVAKLKKPYMFEGETYTEINLTGLQDLTAKDVQAVADEVMARPGGSSAVMPEADPSYAYYLAYYATGIPPEAFERMPIRTFRTVNEEIDEYLQGVDADADDPDEPGVMVLLDPVKINGRECKELNLEGLDDLTGMDTQAAETYAKKLRSTKAYRRAGILKAHQAFAFFLAARALGVQIRELYALSFRDAIRLQGRILRFLADMD